MNGQWRQTGARQDQQEILDGVVGRPLLHGIPNDARLGGKRWKHRILTEIRAARGERFPGGFVYMKSS